MPCEFSVFIILLHIVWKYGIDTCMHWWQVQCAYYFPTCPDCVFSNIKLSTKRGARCLNIHESTQKSRQQVYCVLDIDVTSAVSQKAAVPPFGDSNLSAVLSAGTGPSAGSMPTSVWHNRISRQSCANSLIANECLSSVSPRWTL